MRPVTTLTWHKFSFFLGHFQCTGYTSKQKKSSVLQNQIYPRRKWAQRLRPPFLILLFRGGFQLSVEDILSNISKAKRKDFLLLCKAGHCWLIDSHLNPFEALRQKGNRSRFVSGLESSERPHQSA